MVNLEIIDNALKIKFNGDTNDRQEVLDMLNKGMDQNLILKHMTKSYWVNGWGVHFGYELSEIADCLIICEDSSTTDNGDITLCGKAFTNIHKYQRVNPISLLLQGDIIEFYLWDEFDNVTFSCFDK